MISNAAQFQPNADSLFRIFRRSIRQISYPNYAGYFTTWAGSQEPEAVSVSEKGEYPRLNY